MANIVLGTIERIIIHYVGNASEGQGGRFAEELTNFDNSSACLLKLLNSCLMPEVLHQFAFTPSLDLHPVYQFVTAIFDNKNEFVKQSKHIGRYLYDKSTHPNIKGGELVIAYLSNCIVDDTLVDCIGIFKSESKETVLKIEPNDKGFLLSDVSGLNVSKVDKGCLIFNTDRDSGYIVSVVDNVNKSSDAQYWKDGFLGVTQIRTAFLSTRGMLSLTREFVTQHLTDEYELAKVDQIELLNRSVNYFKTHETFDKSDFEQEVFGNAEVIESFRKFDQTFKEDRSMDIEDCFQINAQAVKKEAKIYKKVLKLDKNFDIHIHGDRNLLEKGVDVDGRKYYKIYYNEEN